MDQTCCPQYPIRCNAIEFKISKSQKKVIKRVNRFLNTGVRPDNSETRQDVEVANEQLHDSRLEVFPGYDKSGSDTVRNDVAAGVKVEAKIETAVVEAKVETTSSAQAKERTATASVDNVDDLVAVNASNSKERKIPRPGDGADPMKPKCKKAKLMRQERRLEKLAIKADRYKKVVKEQPATKSLEDLLNDISDTPAHKLEIKLVRSGPSSEEFERTIDESHAVYLKYQLNIHKDKPSKPVMKQYKRFLCNSPLQIRLVRNNSAEFQERGTESYAVFRKYQMAIHKEKPSDCERIGYKRFLVDSPLQSEHNEGGFPDGFGSFHQQYILDGKIIAVGVIDILPNCTSSVYLYYDPEYYFMSLGTYSALRELAFTRYLHSMEPSIVNYYMGFYIHSCPKMKYKGKYEPSFLNCPQTYGWYPVSEVAPKLDVNKYCRFADERSVDENGDIELNNVLVLHQRQAMPYMIYKMMNSEKNDESEVTQYARFTGKSCAQRMLLYRS